MKRYSLPAITFCLIFFLTACSKKSGFELKGELNSLSSDMILAIYDDPKSKTDTIYPKDGKFTYSVPADTLSIFRLVNDSGKSIPIFANKGWQVTLKGNFDTFTIEGEGPNKELQEFRAQITNRTSQTEIQQAAEAFVKSHPQSLVSAYLINQYFVQIPHPDEAKIKSLTEPLSGNVKDCRILSVALKSLTDNSKQRNRNKEYVNYFSAKARSGKYISWNSSKDQYILINFWASWDKKSKAASDSLYATAKEFKNKELKVLNISLDYDKDQWEKSCKEDTEQWTEICDRRGWGNQIIEQMNIQEIPANILVNSSRKVLATDLYGDDLRNKIKELTKDKKK